MMVDLVCRICDRVMGKADIERVNNNRGVQYRMCDACRARKERLHIAAQVISKR